MPLLLDRDYPERSQVVAAIHGAKQVLHQALGATLMYGSRECGQWSVVTMADIRLAGRNGLPRLRRLGQESLRIVFGLPGMGIENYSWLES